MHRYMVWAFIAAAPILTGSALSILTEDVSNGDNWKCRDGSYIPMEARCDGVLDCKDNSDESHALCWKLSCPPSRFRCAYGACVDSTAPCNGKEECADGSDEVMPRCRKNEKPIHNATFTCYNNETIPAIGLCDGVKDCVDGSDESLAYCAGRRCAYGQFQCKYGACVDPGSNCDANQIQHCADASDESDELCNRNTTTPSIDAVDEVIRPCDGFRCNDGQCLPKEKRCDLNPDCSLSEDEHGCENLDGKCSYGQWSCHDGSCIPQDALCDGNGDCPDLSDETHAICRKHACPSHRFRCTYGACVDHTAPCNDVYDCADGSDELLPMCRNQTLVVNGKFTCSNGDEIFAEELCDGTKNCADGSDEMLSSCAAQRCTSQQFQCEYGACVDPQSECQENRNQDCADGSDETDELCNRITVPAPPKCVVPPHPENGAYMTAGQVAEPGQKFDSVTLTVDCPAPYRPDGPEDVSCVNGVWSGGFPECKPFCELPRHHSVTYFCGDRECNEFEPTGTKARPVCKDMYGLPVIYAEHDYMSCDFDTWSYIATCQLHLYYVTEGNNLTLHIGKNIAVHVSGSQYTVSVEDAHETIITKSMAITLDGPNEIVSDDTVVMTPDDTVVMTPGETVVVSETTPEPERKRPSPHFNPKYFRPRP